MKTLQSLSLINEEERITQINFFKMLNQNKLGVSIFKPQDIEILVDCLDVFKKTGVNYFKRYIAFIDNLSHPIEKGFDELNNYHKELHQSSIDNNLFDMIVEQRIIDMKFFGIDQANGLTIDDYKQLLTTNVDKYPKTAEETKVESRSSFEEEEYIAKRIIDQYFNFKSLNTTMFESEFNRCLKEMKENKRTKHDLPTIDVNSNETYLIASFLTNTPIKIEKTSNLPNWILKNSRSQSNVTFGLCPVKPEYADELLTKLYIHFDIIQTNETMISNTNKMYATLPQAEMVYRKVYNITAKKLRKNIKNSGISRYNFGSTTVIEKKELDLLVENMLKAETNQ